MFYRAIFALSLLILPSYVGLSSSYSNHSRSTQKLSSLFRSLYVSGSDFDRRMFVRRSATLVNYVRTFCDVDYASLHPLLRGLSVAPVVNRCLLKGQRLLRIPITFLRKSLFSLIRLRASFFDTTGTAVYISLHPSLFCQEFVFILMTYKNVQVR